MNPLQENIQTASTRIAQYLTQHQTATSWQLKVLFHLSASALYLALGALYQQGKIRLQADGINYHITWLEGAPAETPLAPNIPIQENM